MEENTRGLRGFGNKLMIMAYFMTLTAKFEFKV